MIGEIIEMSATVVDVLFLVWFVSRFHQVPLLKKRRCFLWAALLLIYQLIADRFWQGPNFLYMAGVFLLSLLFSFSLKKDNWLWAFFAAFAYVIVIMSANTAVYTVFSLAINHFSDYMPGFSVGNRFLFVLICKITQFSFYRAILQLFKKNQNIDLLNGILSFAFSLLTALGLGVLMRIALIEPSHKTDLSVAILSVVLILVNLILYVMIYQVQNLMKSKYTLSLIQRKMESERARVEDAQLIWQNIRKTKHDLKNHFTVMRGYLEEDRVEDCKNYLDGLNQTVENMGDLIHSGNSVIDYLINSKLSSLGNVQVLVSGYVGNFDDMDAVDLACILGNIIDNATEAQKKVEKTKRIELLFLQKNGNRIIICKNTIAESVLKKNRQLLSTKASPEGHGIGHQIVETTVRKYHGMVDYFEQEEMFGVEIILPESDSYTSVIHVDAK